MNLRKIFLHLSLMSICVMSSNLFAGSFNLGGIIWSASSFNVETSTLTGSGTVHAPNITISCDKFCFTGTLSCSGVCKIYVKKDFDHRMFKREGKGKFLVIVGAHSSEHHTHSTLLNKVNTLLFEDSSSVKEKSIEGNLEKIRYQVLLNGLDEDLIVKAIQKKIELLKPGVPVSLKEESDKENSNTPNLVVGGLLSSMGLAAAGLVALKYDNQALRDFFNDDPRLLAMLLGGVSFVGLFSVLYEFLAPEKLFMMPSEELLMIQETCNKVFSRPYVSETKVIKLQ